MMNVTFASAFLAARRS